MGSGFLRPAGSGHRISSKIFYAFNSLNPYLQGKSGMLK